LGPETDGPLGPPGLQTPPLVRLEVDPLALETHIVHPKAEHFIQTGAGQKKCGQDGIDGNGVGGSERNRQEKIDTIHDPYSGWFQEETRVNYDPVRNRARTPHPNTVLKQSGLLIPLYARDTGPHGFHGVA